MKRIIIAQFKLETNTFTPKPTTLDAYRQRTLNIGSSLTEQTRGTSSELGAFLDVFGARQDVELLPAIDANACPGGIMTRETFAYITEALLDCYRRAEAEAARGEADHVAGIALALHGAQITEDTKDGEGLLLEKLREVTGPELPIVVTLDFHANLTEKMVKLSTALFPARYYPHTDFYERGADAARMLLDILDGKAHPTAAMVQLRLIYPQMPSDMGHLARLIPMLQEESRRKGVYYAAFVAGFCRSDISIQGACLYALTENDPARAADLCRRYAQEVYDHLEEYSVAPMTPAEAVADAIAYPGLTVLADAADNPGSGLMGDATEILHELRRQKAERVIVGSVCDPDTVQQAFAAGPGKTIHIRLGGKSGDKVGAPVEADAYVRSLSDGMFRVKGPMFHQVLQDYGPTAVLCFDGITCIVNTNRIQSVDEEVFRSNGVEPLDSHIVVIKSAVHYRAAWKSVTDHILTVDAPNVTSFDDRKVAFRRVPRPIYPLDDADTVRAAGWKVIV